MDDIRIFIKKIAPKNSIKLSIKYEETNITYKYKYYDYNFILKEYNDEDKIELIYNKIIYNNYNDIQLVLFELFEYKTIEYIDIYLQKKLEKTKIKIEDIYNDYYDDYNDELICIRILKLDDNIILKIKFIVYDKSEIKMYYNNDVIIGYDNIIKKIDELIKSFIKL